MGREGTDVLETGVILMVHVIYREARPLSP